eukprot:g4149.t1
MADKIRRAFTVEEGESDSDDSEGEIRERKEFVARTQSDGRLSKTNSVIDKLCCWEELSIEVGKEYTFAMAMERCRGGKIDREDSTVSVSSTDTQQQMMTSVDWDDGTNSEGSAVS